MMRGEVIVDRATQILRFRFEARATLKDWIEAQAAFLRLVEETGFRRALVDIRGQRVAASDPKLFEFGQNIPLGFSYAVLSDPHRGDHEFVETVALNRGKDVRLFHGSEEEAIEWLLAR